MAYLLDTGILLRAFDPSSAEHESIVRSLHVLRDRDETLVVTVQNLAEFWNVSTRPVSANGYGLSPERTGYRLELIEQSCLIRTESAASFSAWKDLVRSHELRGVSVHDARLVAVMISEGIGHLLTLNQRDFSRYAGIKVATPIDITVAS